MKASHACPPLRHTIAEVGLIGGGQVPMPDEVSLVPTACSS